MSKDEISYQILYRYSLEKLYSTLTRRVKDSYYTHSPVYSLYNSAICFCIRTIPPTSGCLSTSNRARGY
ncbi:TPA_asm: hypothetical protein GB248_06615 [Salmonella enterica subsp. enterica]|uniref:Uncharacterized protein n=1 Tax=Salmonella enterica I TaxID=59201 RepID=A0A3U2RUU2_SALET|nr:hypothetical protein [Salmonella enterica subsp. enterica serovar Hessarek]ECG0996784.1 hypothetical protein [Salmonella enterica subsp. enterica]EBU7023175.1 hypothetical protein [Salmonella enterica subsp. enterica serovar Hessarek]EEN0965994.1 hypothetical protein [Salmonella enterica subsp. enterica serovar Hessarek]MJQ26568.1 hypothetical protein [Salmonella enterica subsp. enterica serovar Hessarek]